MLNHKIMGVSGFLFSLSMTSVSLAAMQSMPVQIHTRNGTKVIELMRIHLTKQNKQLLGTQVTTTLANDKKLLFAEPQVVSKFEVGMNGVPVLDQGVWGTCVTFASSAVVDATLLLTGKDMASPLCSLELSRSLKNPDESGGWDGSTGQFALSQLSKYGFINEDYQARIGCGGLTVYPVDDDAQNGAAMPISLFAAHSNHFFSRHYWKTLLPMSVSFKPISPVSGKHVLDKVRSALLRNHRVLFGTLLAPFVGEAGAVGSFHDVKRDTWVLTKDVLAQIKSGVTGGHEMVIIGFNNHACATYTARHGALHQQCGLLHLRNSWSSLAGDHGDFYMTYDYFKTMVLEAYEVGHHVS